MIYNCFVYSRHKCWGRKKNDVFKQQIKTSDLPTCKVEETTLKKLYSITSQINKYLTPEVMTETEKQGRLRAEQDFSVLSDEEKQVFDESIWTTSEKWTLLWCTFYAESKHSTPKDISKEWFSLFQHHCPSKKNTVRSKITTQKSNIIRSKVFSERQLELMRIRVQTMVQDSICPVENPIEVPPVDQNCVGRVQEMVDHPTIP